MKMYTTIGSRETPTPIQWLMARIGRHLNLQGHGIRSGGARGADTAFQVGSMASGLPNRRIYLPNAEFTLSRNGSQIPLSADPQHTILDRDRLEEAIRILQKHRLGTSRIHPSAHPREILDTDPVSSLFARNVAQVLGGNFNNPSAGLIGYMPTSGRPGGSKIAFDLALARGIPTFNLADKHTLHTFLSKYGGPSSMFADEDIRSFMASRALRPQAFNI